VPITLLRDIDQANGLCNGTRMQVFALSKNVICAIILTGTNIGEKILISRMNLILQMQVCPLNSKEDNFQ